MSEPLASLHVDAGREFRGGQRQVLCLLRGLQQRGHRVLLCCPRAGALFGRAQTAGIETQALTIRSGLDFPSAVRLARIVGDEHVDLVHVHDSHSHSIARAAQGLCHDAALRDNLFVTRRSIGVDRGVLGRFKYASDGTSYIAISGAVRKALQEQGVAADHIAVVPSGVETAAVDPEQARTAENAWGLRGRGGHVVGTIGHLTREKNHALLLQVFALLHAEMPDSQLLIAGSGPLDKALRKRGRDLGLEANITWTGHLDDVRPALAALDVFVLTSDTEGLCTSLLDAMGAGVPVVTTAVGGVLSIARHGVSALVVPPRDAPALAGAVSRILQQPDLAQQLIAGGRTVARDHSVDHMVEKTLTAYRDLGHFSTTASHVSKAP